MKHLQNHYLSEEPVQISYEIDNNFVTLSEALKKVLPKTTFETINETLDEELGILRIKYTNDLTIYINRTKTKSFELTDGVSQYTLSPNGFWAKQGSEFLAYSAKIKGVKTDYICPAEGTCGKCPLSGLLYLPLILK